MSRAPAVRALSVAEVVAARLRGRIVSGELSDGDMLPRQEDLLAEFGISRPSLRAALRILETEGLLQVRRGKIGGATVIRPRVESMASALEVILRSREVRVDDVAIALRHLEPVCAGLCASRADRHETVLPRLRVIHEQAGVHIDDVVEYTRLARQFHEEMTACAGNETILLVVGALESILSSHAELWARASLEDSSAPIWDPAYRRRGQSEHDFVLRLIERGDADGASREARQHLEWTPLYTLGPGAHVQPRTLRQEEA